MNTKKLAYAIASFALVGLAIAVYSFLHNQSLASGEFCTIGETFNCDVVNKGPYSVFLGIPVSVIGIMGYLFIIIGSIMLANKPKDKALLWFVSVATASGLMFSLYLTGIEAFVLDTWCLLCLTSQAMMALITAAVVGIWYTDCKDSKNKKESM